MEKFLVLHDNELNTISGGVFHAYSARGFETIIKALSGLLIGLLVLSEGSSMDNSGYRA